MPVQAQRPSPLVAACLALCLDAGTATAATAGDGRTSALETLITTPTKRAQAARLAPAMVVVLTDEEIRERGYHDLVDAIRDLPAVVMIDHRLGESGLSQLSLRGTASNRAIAFLLNGRRFHVASTPQLDIFPFIRVIPLLAVKRIELSYGPASALYGADAMTGVLNIVTKSGAEMEGVTLEGSYGLRNTTSDQLALGAVFDEGVDVLALAHAYRSDGEDLDRLPSYVGSTADRQFWPGSPDRDASLATDSQLASYHHQGFSLDFFRRAYDAPSAVPALEARYAGTSLARWRAAAYTLGLGYEATIGAVDTSTSLTYDLHSLNAASRYVFNPLDDPAAATPTARAAFLEGYKWGFGRALRLEQTFAHEVDQDLGFVAGAAIEDHSAVPQTQDLPRPVDPNGSLTSQGFEPRGLNVIQFQNLGAYGQVQLGYVPRLQTTLGARLDVSTRHEAVVNPRLGIVYGLDEATVLKGMWGTSYAPPTINQMFSSWGEPGTYMSFPNPALRPERSTNLEVGLLRDLAPGVVLGLSAYRVTIADVIEDRDAAPRLVDGKLTPGTMFRNEGFADIVGCNARVDAHLPGGHALYGSVAGVDARQSDLSGQQEARPDTAPLVSHAGLTLRLADGVVVTPRVTWLSGWNTTARNKTYAGRPIPGALLLDLGARAEVAEGWALTASGSNLLDTHFAANGEYQVFTVGDQVPQPGRRLLLGLSRRL